jgi:hypothetical protein
MNPLFPGLLLLASAALLPACSDAATDDTASTTADAGHAGSGQAGTAGSAGQATGGQKAGGSAGTAGQSGNAGTAGQGDAGAAGQAGSTGQGGNAGGAGMAGSGGDAQGGAGGDAGTAGQGGKAGSDAGSGGAATAGSGDAGMAGSGGAGMAGSGGAAMAGAAGMAGNPAGARLLAPLSTARVTSQTPTLRWVLPAGADGAQVELCHDRGCTQPIGAFDATGDHGAPAAALAAGVVFWRVTATSGGVAVGGPSAVWQFDVGPRNTPVDTSWGTTLDLNGDGFADIAVGAAGKVYVYHGSAAGLPASPSASLDESDVTLPVSAGDINGDGYDDLAVGVPSDHNDRGAVQVYLGGPGGVATTASYKLVGPDSNSNFGGTLTSGGDLDEDGYADLLVGAPNALLMQGAVYVFRGGPQGFAAEPTVTLIQPDPGSYFGYSLTSGDFDGDGHPEIVISAAYGGGGRGAVYMYRGGPFGILTGGGTSPAISRMGDGAQDLFGVSVSAVDTNGDGLADLVVGTYVVSDNHGIAYAFLGKPGFALDAPDRTMKGSLANGGGVFARRAGDVNGDGYEDVALLLGTAALGQGSVDVLLGGPSEIAPALTLTNTDSMRYLESTSGIGDSDGDGFADLALGTPGFQNAGPPGTVEIHRGGAQGPSATPSTTLTSGVIGDIFGTAISGN